MDVARRCIIIILSMLPVPLSCGVWDKCSWFGDGDAFPLQPDGTLLQRIASVGGYLFTIQARATEPRCLVHTSSMVPVA